MKTLTVTLADLEGVPHADSAARTNADVSVRYTGPVHLTDGTIIPAAVKPKTMGSGSNGRVAFEVYESDSNLVKAEYRGFAVRVDVDVKRTDGRAQPTRFTRTVKVLSSSPSPVALGSLDPAEGLPAKFVTVADFADALEAQVAAAGEDATQALTEAQAARADASALVDDYGNLVTLAQQAQAAALEVPDANVSAMIGNPTTDTATALTTFQDQRSRAAALTDATGNPLRWWVARRTPDAYAIVGLLPSGLYWSWDLMRDNTNPGGFRTTITGNYSCVGVPMKYAPYQDATYTGGTWARQSSLIGTTGLPLPGLMAGQMEIEVDVVAGDRNCDPVGYPEGFPDRVGHAIVIHGAGSGGTDLETQISNVTAQGRIVLKASPLPGATGRFTAMVYPAFIISANGDATATATYTTPPGSTRVGVSATPSVAGGIWSVTLDGDATAASMCPTGAQLLEWGYVTAADMASSGGPIHPERRYVDFHYSQPGTHRPIGIARGLAPGEHTVTLAATGVQHPGGSNVRALISGFAYGTEADTPDDPDVSVYGQWWVIPEESAVEFAHEVAPAAGGTPTFVGSQHGWEDQTAPLDIAVDGTPYTLDPGTGVGGTLVSITRTSRLHHPDAAGPIADVVYEWSAATGRPLTVSHRMTWLQDVTVTHGYPVHCNLDAATLPNGIVDTSATVLDMRAGDNSYKGVARNRVLAAWGPSVLFVENVPAAQQVTGGWASNTNILHSFRARSAGAGRQWTKTYLSRQGSPAAGQVWTARAEYSVGLTFGDFTPPA